ncbi:low molecular weight protein arginine phosphatase [Bacillus sp. Marseille-P3661]|uniref:low molecular weight protein arginine phosphatase n=1 Tax=Bacillus sp. Marseille-P3661 TaxID=1936234 RepID=UPI000C85A320|nr:low molecular weight protein arginine phosphatase [Bacillus sp. Marseille-P3661]
MHNILFVCTGNTCRSPMAEAIFRHRANSKYNVKSAGVFATDGSPAAAHSIKVLTDQEIPINHKSKLLTNDLIQWSDLILTMTAGHKHMVQQHFPKALDKVYSLNEYVRNKDHDISDPFGGSLDDYREIYQELDEIIAELIEKL